MQESSPGDDFMLIGFVFSPSKNATNNIVPFLNEGDKKLSDLQQQINNLELELSTTKKDLSSKITFLW